MTQEKRPGMALWLKITIGVLMLGVVSAIGLVVVGGMFVFDAAKKATDPESVSRVADSVAKMDDPLPKGFTRVLAVDMMGMSEVGYANQRAGLTIMFMKMANNSKHSSADFFVDSYIKTGAPNAPGASSFSAIASPPIIQSKGTMLVGGEEMPYAIAERKFNQITNFQMVGCVVPPSTGRPVVILGQTSKSTLHAYPMELTKKFLAAVKGF